MSPDELASVLASDVVLGSAVPASIKPLNMDEHAQLLAEERECTAMVAWWTQRGRRVKARIAEIMGEHTVGTVNGNEVVFYEPQKRFNSTEFKKQYPDMYQAYSRPVTESQFDADWFQRSQPDIYRRFQVRPLRVTYEAPGA